MRLIGNEKFFKVGLKLLTTRQTHSEPCQTCKVDVWLAEAATRGVLLEKGVLRNSAKFTEKHLCQSLQEHLFYRTPLEDCFFTWVLHELLKIYTNATNSTQESWKPTKKYFSVFVVVLQIILRTVALFEKFYKNSQENTRDQVPFE